MSSIQTWMPFLNKGNHYDPNKIKRVSLTHPISASAVGNPTEYIVYGKKYHVRHSSKNYTTVGFPAFYSSDFIGKATNSGEIYNPYTPSVSSNVLPVPCYAVLTNLENHRGVVVRVNDRGPFSGNTVTRISYAAAELIGITYHSKHPPKVRLTTIGPYTQLSKNAHSAIPHLYYIQLAILPSKEDAYKMKDFISNLSSQHAKNIQVREIQAIGPHNGQYGVYVGPFNEKEEAKRITESMQSAYAISAKIISAYQ